MPKIKLIIKLCVLLIIAGCSTAAQDTVPDNFVPSQDKGIVVGTLTFEHDMPKNDIYRFFYYPQTQDKKFNKRNDGKIMIKARINNDRAFNGDFNNKKTYLFVIEREPGNYAFTQYNYLDHIGYSGMVTTSHEFSIPFEIKNSEIAYIGEVTFNDLAEPGSPRLVVSNNFDRDIREFRKKYPQINWDKAFDKTIKSGNNGDGIIDFR